MAFSIGDFVRHDSGAVGIVVRGIAGYRLSRSEVAVAWTVGAEGGPTAGDVTAVLGVQLHEFHPGQSSPGGAPAEGSRPVG